MRPGESGIARRHLRHRPRGSVLALAEQGRAVAVDQATDDPAFPYPMETRVELSALPMRPTTARTAAGPRVRRRRARPASDAGGRGRRGELVGRVGRGGRRSRPLRGQVRRGTLRPSRNGRSWTSTCAGRRTWQGPPSRRCCAAHNRDPAGFWRSPRPPPGNADAGRILCRQGGRRRSDPRPRRRTRRNRRDRQCG